MSPDYKPAYYTDERETSPFYIGSLPEVLKPWVACKTTISNFSHRLTQSLGMPSMPLKHETMPPTMAQLVSQSPPTSIVERIASR